jgi:S1-C subfamily serine protease
MSGRNEDDLSGVADGMDPTDTPNVEDTGAFDIDPPPEPTEPSHQSWESEPTEPLPETSDPEPESSDLPYMPFVYDDPISQPQLDPRPEPVSARIHEVPQKKKSNAALFFVGALVAGILGALLTVGLLAATGTFDDPEVAAAPPTTTVTGEQATQATEIPPPQIINDLGAAINPTAVAAKAVPSIVTVTVANAGADEDSPAVGIGSGSGVVMSSEGYIITNHHVVEGGDTFSVEFEDGRIYEATLVGSDDLTDIAVLQIKAARLTPVDFGSSESLRIGDPAVAIGNPLGQDGGASVTVGIISAFDRRVDFADDSFLHGMIQTDAAINSGSSGGALFDSEGNLIGITSAIGVSQAGPEGIGYAIPIELVDRITAEIIETGDVVHPFLGVQIGTFLKEANDGAIIPGGAIIDSIEGTDSAAGLAGLQSGDVIIGIGDKTITDQTDLILAVRLYRVGDEVAFVALRGAETMTFDVVMGRRPAEFGG